MHAALFGSVARGEATAASDIDIMVEIAPDAPVGAFENVSALPLWHDDLDHPERAKNPALIRNIKSDGIRL